MNSVNVDDALVDELGRATSLLELLDVAARWIPDITDADRASITLLSDDTQSLTLYAMGDRTVIPSGTRFALDDTIVGQTFALGETINVDDVRSRPEVDMQHLAGHGFRCALTTPLMSAGKALGTVNVGRLRSEPFNEADTRVLRSIANLMATYIAVQLQLEREQEAGRRDELTGLWNRKTTLRELRSRLDALTGDEELAILFLDVDGFKGINDAYGHALGDAMLAEIGSRLNDGVRAEDDVGRIGGDEFLAFCPVAPDQSVVEIAQRLVDLCSRPVEVGNITIRPRVSVGVTRSHSSKQTLENLMAEADHAMYRAKRSGSAVCEVDDHIRRQVDFVVAVDRDLALALHTDALDYHFQPICSVTTGELVGAEALLRWKHPHLGAIPPSLVLERIEATGEIEAFTRWSLRRICSSWSRIGQAVPALASASVAINLNPSQLGLADYPRWHMSMLDEYSLDPQNVIVEIVESGLIEVDAGSQRTIRELADRGVTIGLDDFGTGYNALAYFARFPIHVVKFDRSLTNSITNDHTIRTILAGLVQITQNLDIVSIAEGVETTEELAIVDELGIDRVQGYLLGHAMPAAGFMTKARAPQKLKAGETSRGSDEAQ